MTYDVMDQRDGTNRDLLVGLLALQNGLVDQDVLILAFAPGPVIGPGRSPRSWRLKVRSTPTHEPCSKGLPSSTSAATTTTPRRASRRWLQAVPFESASPRSATLTSRRPSGTSARNWARPTTTTMPTAPAAMPLARPLPTDSGSASCGLTLAGAWAKTRRVTRGAEGPGIATGPGCAYHDVGELTSLN